MLDPFYLIIDDAKWLPRFLPLGLKLVQLRIKDQPEAELRAQIRDAKAVCAEAGCQLVVNDYWRLALDLGCDFVHLGQEDLDDADVAAIRAGGLRLGVSTHDDSELLRALDLAPDYVALGPVYHTILKAMKWAPQGVEKVTGWKEKVGTIPLVAIGGMTVERAPAVYDAGADVISAVTDVLLAENPENRLTEWLELTTARRTG
ncbi:thiamine phosphate synthase [Pelagibius sp. Alg239-R121]|uniref:thiamine phosphate synthase n=1 Tax=Pelagibius sp. Alg239-R121 TaxID=2993448 RepID=UPI002AC3510B|nr:thiamine phosphate synthase [Pelagibius sp. Alg239-R121]